MRSLIPNSFKLAPLLMVAAACQGPAEAPSVGAARITDHPAAALPGLEGAWYLDAAGTRASVVFHFDGVAGHYLGSHIPEDSEAAATALDQVSWDSRRLSFRRVGAGFYEWYRGTVVAGVFTGRLARTTGPAAPPETSFTTHFSAWSSALDKDLVPRVFDLRLADGALARLRLDRDSRGAFLGRLKQYASLEAGAEQEQLSWDVQVSTWDGQRLAFSVPGGGLQGTWTGQVRGRLVNGTASIGGTTVAFSGARAEVLSHGLHDLSPAERDAWQRRTRAALKHLMMADDPAPLTTAVQVLQTGVPPQTGALPRDRDDDPQQWPQAYTLSELRVDFALPNPYGGPALSRTAHAWMSTPLAPPPPGGYPMVVALNGHEGSAYQVFDPANELYYYGDAYARRGYVVLALDLSHRPREDRDDAYADWDEGDDPDHGNGPHPSIRAAGYDSDFEEDGERVWDVLHSVEAVRARTPGLSPDQLVLTGLSMGGEITTYAGALDDRFPVVVPAGFSPDFGVMAFHTNHPCWQWTHSNLREYLDASDLHALTAPRTLIIETGRADPIYSDLDPPFAADKQVVRRSRAAYADAPGNLTHYLHYDAHHYHFGDVNPSWPSELGLRVPASVAPAQFGQVSWEIDRSTLELPSTLFDAISAAPAGRIAAQ